MKDKGIAIIGAGIGGLTVAIALREQGFKRIQIFERTKAKTTLGAGLVLWPNAICILERLGLKQEIEKRSGRLKSMLRFSQEGEALGGISIEHLDEQMGFNSRPITRSTLHEILSERAAALGIEVYHGKNVATLEETDTKCTRIGFDEGEEVVSDLVIGADGRMKSAARKYVLGENEPVYQHYVNWVGLVQNEALAINKTQSVHDYWGVGERFGYVPVNATTSYWAGCKKLPLGMGIPEIGNKAELERIFNGWPDPIAEVIRKTSEHHIKRIEVFDHDPIATWYRNSVCLLGDAAHAALPTSGQGACQAIEDAWHLAQCLSSEKDTCSAFEAFQGLRVEKTSGITMGARGFAKSLFNEDEKYCATRNKNAQKANAETQIVGMANLWGKFLPRN